MDRMLRIGFRKVGEWLKTTKGIAYKLESQAPHPNTLYAFFVNGEVKYVGKTTQTLKGRLQGYATPSATQRTNTRLNRCIAEAIAADQTVEIYVLPDEGLHHYGVFHLNLAAGLEDAIIREMSPIWNGGKMSNPKDDAAPSEVKEKRPAATFAFSIVLQKSYWDFGFFNTGIEFSDHFGGDGQPIEMFFDQATEPFLGTINRTANKRNRSPRIFGGKALREWAQKSLKPMDTLFIEVLSPTAIRLTAAPKV